MCRSFWRPHRYRQLSGYTDNVKAYDMGAACVRDLMKRTGIPGEAVDEVIFGNQFQAGNNANPARWAALYGGLPESVPSFTPMKNCGTGLKSIVLGVQSIQTGNNDVVISGGMESMSGCPYYLMGARQGYRMGHGTTVRDGLFEDGLLDPIVKGHMGLTAENLASTTTSAARSRMSSLWSLTTRLRPPGRPASMMPISSPSRSGPRQGHYL